MLPFSQTPWMLPFTGLLLPLGSLILCISKQQRDFASPRVSLLELWIKIPLAPARWGCQQDLRCCWAGPSTHRLSDSSATLHLWSVISWMGFPSCSHPHWLWCTISVSFHVSLPSSRLFILMLFKEEIKSLKSSDFKSKKIEFWQRQT